MTATNMSYDGFSDEELRKSAALCDGLGLHEKAREYREELMRRNGVGPEDIRDDTVAPGGGPVER